MIDYFGIFLLNLSVDNLFYTCWLDLDLCCCSSHYLHWM